MKREPRRTFIQWSNKELNQFLAVVKQAREDKLYEFFLFTGLRLGEALALSWSDIDFEKGTCTVRQNRCLRAFRIIKLSPYLLNKLEKQKEIQQSIKAEYGEFYQHDIELVFPNNDGSIQLPHNVLKKFIKLMEKANVRRIPFNHI